MKLDLKQTTILMGMCSALGMYAPEVQASNGEANSLYFFLFHSINKLNILCVYV